MKTQHTLLLVASLFAGALALTGCHREEHDHSKHDHGATQPPAAGKTAAKPYPLKTCIVSDEKFGGKMGEPVSFVYQGQEIKLCCKDCRKDFDKEPAKFLAKLPK